ncbi:dynein light chain [Histoplasma capsulatum var. duboisii H88]|uniref:Dynein light chain n=1 Tax=Ajellomyces capsulatus (strain H88) TaxID=544711 RepID=F0U548_AJEC8|nr:dynein light chain [Histoplasma capsulatum var. duboisii H88]QSS52334.1 dynein light chain [Histoplasma capsulatum var. duboisii H88]
MGGEAGGTNLPIPIADLTEIATDACDAALEDVQSYDHEQVGQWSSHIINTVLQSLIEATTPDQPDDDAETDNPQPPPYRFNVNCTIIQQGVTAPDTPESREKVGKRGMHSASGAYWDVSRDGMWTFKYPNAEDKGLDLVLNIVWFGAN